jgi:hypothetical protein|uniref:Uncharacterized protein n=1 Tax=viral metagenome TaxID=1070528 RepID=A0A6C0IMJ7_9ZZZZ
MLSKYLDVKIFLASLAFGLFAVYITVPAEKKIMVYPSPDNVEILQYKDKTGTCFSFQQKEVQCPRDSSKIETLKPQA